MEETVGEKSCYIISVCKQRDLCTNNWKQKKPNETCVYYEILNFDEQVVDLEENLRSRLDIK